MGEPGPSIQGRLQPADKLCGQGRTAHFSRAQRALCGDAVLAEVAARMRATLRTTDLKCRYGGDEFLVILPETPLAGAMQVCESLHQAIEQDPVTWTDGAVPVTASFGVTKIAQGELDPMAVVARSDAALYRSKQGGRNRVTVAEHEAVPA